jgi:hypothetical protein
VNITWLRIEREREKPTADCYNCKDISWTAHSNMMGWGVDIPDVTCKLNKVTELYCDKMNG